MQLRCVESTSTEILIKHLQCTKKSNERFVVSATWVSKRISDFLCGEQHRYKEDEKRNCASTREAVERMEGSQGLEISWWRIFADVSIS